MSCICFPWLQRIWDAAYSVWIHAALPARSPDQAQLYWERLQRFLQGEGDVQGARESICCPLAGPYFWYEMVQEVDTEQVVPSRNAPRVAGRELAMYSVFTPLLGDAQALPPLFLVPCSLLGYNPLCKSLFWLTVQ